jgi:hypothetical protein
MAIVPRAVSLGRNGYLQVDYDRLGLKFMSWKTWLRHNGAELRSDERQSGNLFRPMSVRPTPAFSKSQRLELPLEPTGTGS